MASLEVTVPHQLGQQGAFERVQQFLDVLQRQYAGQISNVQGQWENHHLAFSLRTYGFDIKGALKVEERQVRVSTALPLAAELFRGKIESWIEGELQRQLAHGLAFTAN